MVDGLSAGPRLDADDGVILAYPSGRAEAQDLVLGEGARLRSGTVLYAGSRIGDRFSTGHGTVIREQCVIADDVSVWSNTVVDYGCTVGRGVKIHTNCYIAQYSVLHDRVFVAPGVSFANDLYPGDDESAALMEGPVIEEGAQLGVNVTVLPYVRIGAGTLVGAGSVVTHDLPPGVVAFGNPARPRGAVEDLEPIQSRLAARPRRSGGMP